ncbi:unnamed protein product [Caretta caretta]
MLLFSSYWSNLLPAFSEKRHRSCLTVHLQGIRISGLMPVTARAWKDLSSQKASLKVGKDQHLEWEMVVNNLKSGAVKGYFFQSRLGSMVSRHG